MILFFDTETTGFYLDRLPFDHPDQPGLVQIAAILMDRHGNPASQFSLIVNPDREIPEKASAVHKISTAKAQAIGVSEKTALGLFNFLASRSEMVVAHNVKFDLGIMNCVAARCSTGLSQPPSYCTMEASSPIVNLPPTEGMIAAGMNKPKSPRLEECIGFFFNEELDGAHDAFVDVAACARVFFHLIDNGHFALPEVAA